MQTSDQVIDETESRARAGYLSREGVWLPPLLERMQVAKSPGATRCGELAVDEIIAPSGCAMIEALWWMGAQRAAGDRHPGKPAGVIRRHGPRPGVFDGADPTVLYHNPAKSLRRAKILFVIRTSFYSADRCPRQGLPRRLLGPPKVAVGDQTTATGLGRANPDSRRDP